MLKVVVTFVTLLSVYHASANEGFSATRNQYLNNIWEVPIAARDLTKRVRPKHGINDVVPILREHRRKIRQAAAAFNIDPVHVAAAIAGEHAMNVDVFDTIQQYVVQRNNYLQRWADRHNSSEDNLFAMINSDAYSECSGNDYNFWNCVVNKWWDVTGQFSFRRTRKFQAFTTHFFNPNGMGSTFGLGQMSPLRALMLNDRVQGRVGHLTFRENGEIVGAFDHVLDPDIVVYYVAATVQLGIQVYRNHANFDISNNPGLTATLYNLGQETLKAWQRKRDSENAARRGELIEYPQTNDLGKWVNQNIDAIEAAVR